MVRRTVLVAWLFACLCACLLGLGSPARAAPNVAPTVSLTAPANGANYTAPATITLSANAADSDGSVTKVEFFSGTTLLGTATSAPYSYTWSNVAAGTYSLTAKATDNGGAATNSSAVSVTFNAPFNNGPIGFMYDELGRLVGLVDGGGNSAAYAYDALGNMLSITRTNAGSVGIVEFTPNGGPSGTAVTISGTGFGTTTAANTVRFNGVAAVVTSASATQLVAQVPAGATTGSISVTSPNGTATSAASFVVGPSKAPTVSGFAPAIGPAGTAVTITGMNFETTGSNNKVGFNTRPAFVASSTTTSIATTVPATATSGRISVATPYGKATSVGDFIVPPALYGVSDVESTTRMAVGETRTITVGTAGKIAMVLFDGTSGQRVSLGFSGATMSSSSAVSILAPNGTTIGSSTVGAFIDVATLLATGTYTIVVDPYSTSTGSVTLTLYDVPPDATGTITIGGSAVTVSNATPGQNMRVAFSGTSGQRVSLQMTTVTLNSLYTGVVIKNPDGTTLVSSSPYSGFIDTMVLPASGTYTIEIDPPTTNVGSITLTLYNVPPDATGTTTVNGASTAVTTSTPGQNAGVSFDGTAATSVTVRITGNTFGSVTITLGRPDGSSQVSISSSAANFNLTAQTLSVAGTYTVSINPNGTATGSITVAVTSP